MRPTSSARSPPDARRRARADSPASLDPRSPADALPGGSLVTVEPGGQVELASPPLPALAGLVRTAVADAAELHRLTRRGLAVESRAAAADRPPRACWSSPATARWSSLRPHRPARAQRDVLHRRGPGLPRRGRAGRRRPRAGPPCTRSARCWSRRSRTRRACTGGAPAGRPRGWPPGWRSTRAHRAARRPDARPDPAAAWARRVLAAPRAVRAGRRRDWTRRAASRSPPGSRRRCPARPPIDDLDYHVVHAVPAGAPARLPGDALHRHPARRRLGAAGGGARGAAVATRA